MAHNSPNEFRDPLESLWNQAKARTLRLVGNTLHRSRSSPTLRTIALVEMQHVIVRIRRAVVHGEGRYREAAGRFVIQDMLTKGSGEHVLWSPDGEGEKHVWSGSNPEERVHGWYRWGDAPRLFGHIFTSWL